MVLVFIRRIGKLSEAETQNIVDSLSKSAHARLNKKRNGALRLASLCTLSCLTDEQRANLCYTENGRPYFYSLKADISISHSNIYSVVALSDSAEISVGIDVEDVNNEIDHTRYTRFFTENEQKEIENGASPLEIWTKKEALFKYLKNDNVNFISLDTTSASAYFKTMTLNGALLTLCTEKEDQIKIIDNFKF